MNKETFENILDSALERLEKTDKFFTCLCISPEDEPTEEKVAKDYSQLFQVGNGTTFEELYDPDWDDLSPIVRKEAKKKLKLIRELALRSYKEMMLITKGYEKL